jgi:hypothetical protein
MDIIEYGEVGKDLAEANAEFIVRACNSFDDMLAFIEKVAAWDFYLDPSYPMLSLDGDAERLEIVREEAFELIKKVRGL